MFTGLLIWRVVALKMFLTRMERLRRVKKISKRTHFQKKRLKSLFYTFWVIDFANRQNLLANTENQADFDQNGDETAKNNENNGNNKNGKTSSEGDSVMQSPCIVYPERTYFAKTLCNAIRESRVLSNCSQSTNFYDKCEYQACQQRDFKRVPKLTVFFPRRRSR